MPKDTIFAQTFFEWLTSIAGGGRSKSQADQIISRIHKFLCVSNEDLIHDDIKDSDIDFSTGSTENISHFMETMETEWKLGNSGQISYMHTLIDLMDFRKFQGVSSSVLQNFAVVEMFIKRARWCITKKMRVRFSTELDLETLEWKGHWATIKELQQVIPYHLQKYKKVIELCKSDMTSSVSCSDLTFATRFIATFLFLRVKGTQPMTYQFLTVHMFEDGKKNDGYIDERLFKTADRYVFDSIILNNTCIAILDGYVKYIQTVLQPSCSYLLTNRNGKQFCKLTDSILVFEAIGKYVNPTRYRQTIETESFNNLELDECTWISEDQKHSSQVAKTYYQKKRSREVALHGQTCLKKLCGEEEIKMEEELQSFIKKECSDTDDSNIVSNEDDEEIVISQNDTNLKATTREQLNHYVEEGVSLENDIIQHESLLTVQAYKRCSKERRNSPSLVKRINYLCTLLNAIELENGQTY